jgi:proline dehydrogenase
MLRSLFSALSESKGIRSIAEHSTVGQKVSRRFVAGVTVEELIAAAVARNRLGVRVTINNLGESVTNREEVLRSKALCHRLLDEIAKRKLDANLSLKLTHMGLDVDEALVRTAMEELLDHAIAIDNFIRIDMEGSHYTQITLDLVRELHRRPKAAGHIGTVLQSYLYRTEEDAKLLCSEGIRIRLCKGAYKEASGIAYSSKQDVDANYIKIAKQMLGSGVFHGLATHDENIIATIQAWVLKEGIPKTAFEFQMLHGVRRELQESLAKEGWGVRCYIPFGTEWYPYLMRRLAERPANALFLAKNYFKG